MQFTNELARKELKRLKVEDVVDLLDNVIVPKYRSEVPIPPDFDAENGFITVQRMPKRVPDGWKSGSNYIAAVFRPVDEKAVKKWRKNFQSETGEEYDEGQFPVSHMTYLFAQDPSAESSIDDVVKGTPMGPIRFSEVAALGEKGKEHCWVAKVANKEVIDWLTKGRNNPRLNTGHEKFVPKGWPATKQVFDTVVPHVTLVRWLQNMDVENAPPLDNLEDVEFHIMGLMEWVTLKKYLDPTIKDEKKLEDDANVVKIKLMKFYDVPEQKQSAKKSIGVKKTIAKKK